MPPLISIEYYLQLPFSFYLHSYCFSWERTYFPHTQPQYNSDSERGSNCSLLLSSSSGAERLFASDDNTYPITWTIEPYNVPVARAAPFSGGYL